MLGRTHLNMQKSMQAEWLQSKVLSQSKHKIVKHKKIIRSSQHVYERKILPNQPDSLVQ